MRRLAVFLAIFLFGLLSLDTTLAYASLEQQRQHFLAAEIALKKGQQDKLAWLEKQLQSYPLKPYLEYQKLKQRFSYATNQEIDNFLKRYKNTPIADNTRRHWLNYLARKKRWQTYSQFYVQSTNVTRQCHYLHALISMGRSQQAWPQTKKLWLHGRSRPSACDPVFKAWETAGKRTNKLTWQRIDLALQARQWRLAQYLGKQLSNQDTVWLKRWIRTHRNPKNVLRHDDFRQPHPYRERMLSLAVQRMANIEAMTALTLWRKIEKRYPFSPAEIRKTKQRIAIRLERNPALEAYQFVKQQRPSQHEQRLRLAQLRAALLRKDWPQVLTQLKTWPKQQQKEQWHYWHANALMHTGQTATAMEHFKSLAKVRSYYGFLAADKANLGYHLKHAATPMTKTQQNTVGQQPGIQRALELRALQRDTQAKREWYYATKTMDQQTLRAAATLAQDANWPDQAIFTLAKTGYWDDLTLRFPLRHQQWVNKQAEQYQLDNAWIFAVIRQESAFMRDARSHAGAMGLMQLVPATARHVARDYLHKPAPHKKALYQPETNIELGSAHLRQLMDRFNNNPVLVTAAYNAGSHRVKRWLPKQNLPADIWVELVPFKETAGYLRRVLSYSVIYEKRLGRIPKRLRQRMPTVDVGNPQVAAN